VCLNTPTPPLGMPLVFGEQLIIHRSWYPRSLDVNLCSYYLRRISKDS